jgi:hypothetical protein
MAIVAFSATMVAATPPVSAAAAVTLAPTVVTASRLPQPADNLAATVHVLADGAPFVPPQNGLFGTWQAQWDLPIPADCDGCDRTFSQLFERRRTGNPSRRFALLTTTNDEVIRTYFGYGVNDMTSQVNAIVDAQHTQANSHAFVVTGVQHVLIGAYAQPGPLRDFVKQWASGSVDWSTISP